MRLLIFSFCIFLVSGCQPPVEEPKALSAGIYAYNKSSSIEEQHAALLLLTHLALNEEMETAIATDLAKENDPTKQLLLSHLLYLRTQETKYADQFVAGYPTGEGLGKLGTVLRQSGYVAASNPLQNTLAQLAATDDSALAKLAGALPHLDGTDAAMLDEQLTDLYQMQTERIQKAFTDLNIDISQVEGIVNLKNTEK